MRKLSFERASDASLFRYAFIDVFIEGESNPIAAIVMTDDKDLGIHFFNSDKGTFFSFDEIKMMNSLADKLYEDEMEWERVFLDQNMSPSA